ncbi:uncharacterized protein KIAA1671 homolog isoform X1 [Dromiciops gliroides]|uniref:uncharacterized protein KIAA1671 homolog isoform X1 n=1 Tax=Dromiciops gliroides TaxID=33562 RepID=UPI001CC393BC|nr:uncharacterized protein KIAA1671 homolog isoform X1 [Dromiciops gliroides]XP_043819774.1 uncharacterized protein KIAA1671 homolog isoform X1 [Dromiciops gliroides]
MQVTMATRVEVSPLASLTPVPNLNEITKEDKLQVTYYHPISKAPASPPGMVLAGPRNLRTPSRGLLGPRLSPKPFSKESPLDTFANVKSPITSVKPGTVMTRPLTYSKLEDSSAAKALDENMPSLVEPKMDDGGGLSSNVIKPFNKSLPQAVHSQNTIILFETAGPSKAKAKPSSGKWAGEEQKVDNVGQLQGHLPISKTETLAKPALPPRRSVGILQRQASLSSDERPAVLKSWEKGEEKEPVVSPGIKNEGGPPSSEVLPRVRQRPVSAIFESLQNPKPSPLELPGGKVPPPPPEKSWVRKPRPLSVDLTAMFENKDILSKKVVSPSEASKEKGLGVSSNDRGNGEETSEPLDRAAPSKPTLRSKEQRDLDIPDLKNKVKEQNQKIVFRSMEACSSETSTDLTEASARKGWNSLEEKAKQERDPERKEAEGAASLPRSEKSPALAEGKTRAAEGYSKGTERDSSAGGEWVSRGSVKKRVSLFGSENFSSRLSTEAPTPAPEMEKGSVKVQDRIKEWTVESPEPQVPPESRRRSFQSRPLSADLTKVFTRPALESESRLVKGPAPSGELLQDSVPQEKNKEGHILLRTDLNGASAGRNQWKPVKPCEKTRQTERKLSSSNETDGSSFPKEDSTLAPCRLEAQSPSTMAEDDGDFQTVWATVYEHNVVRYTVADHPFLTSSNESARKCSEPPNLGAEKASWSGKGPGGDKVNVRTENSKWAERLNAQKAWSSVLPDEEKSPMNAALLEKHPGGERWNASSVKQAGNSLSHQRIEPRYDIVHMTSERSLSEVVVTAPEEKAVTLRTNKLWSSLKEKQGSQSEGLNTKQQGRLDVKMGPYQASSLAGETQEKLETATPKSEFHKPKELLGGSLPPNKIVEKPYLVNQDKAPGLAGSEKASRSFPCQIAKEKESPAHIPETVVVREAHIDSYNVYPLVSSVEMKKVVSQSPGEGRRQLHDYLNNSHPRVGLRATAKEESFDLRSKKHLGSRSVRKESLIMAEESDWSQSQTPEPEAKVRKSGSTDVRITEKWRRRTLPNDVKFDEFISFAPEPAKRLGRRADSLSPSDAYFKKSRQTQDGLDSKESSHSVPQDAKEEAPKPEPPQEPRETYFAVTYQISGEKREYNTDNSVYENRKTSSLDKDEPVSVHNSRKLGFLSESSPNSRLAPSYPRDPPENPDRKTWQAKEREQENLSFSKSPRPSDQPVQPGERRTRNADGRVIDVDTLWVNQRSKNPSIPNDPKEDGGKRSSRTSEHFMYSSKSSDLLMRRKQGNTHESPRAKAEDGYRSSVLDIDALMAEYKEESMKGADPRDRKEERVPASHGGFQWERPGTRSSADHLSQRYDRRGQKDPQDHTAFRKSANLPGPQRHQPRESSPVMHSGPEINKEKTESPTHEPSRQKAPSTKFTPPLWAMPQSGLAEQYLDSPSDTWKKTPAEDEKKDAASANKLQNTKCHGYRAEPNTPSLDIKNMDTNVPPKTSPVAQDAILFEDEVWAPRNSVGKREKAGSLHGRTKVRRGDYDSDFGNMPVDIKRTYSEKTAPASVRENLSLMQEARERRKEQLKAQQSLPGENLESMVVYRVFPHWETKSSENHKVPQDIEKERVRPANNKSPLSGFTPTPVPRRSHSFCKDKKIEPFMDQLKQCFARQPPEAKDTDTLVQENDSQYGTWNDPRQSGESFAPETPSPDNNVASARKQPPGSRLSSLSSQTEPASPADLGDASRDQRSTSLDRSSTDLDSTDGAEGAPPSDTGPEARVDDFSFINQTSVLDSSALKARAQLSKRNRRRAPISHALRRSRASEAENWSSLVEETDSAWMFKDSTEEKSVKKEESDEEEKTPRSERTPVSQPQRLPIFPGVDPSVLKAQLRKRNELDSPGEAQTSAQLSRSPKSPFQPGALGSRVLPSGMEKEEKSEETSPQWLKDLKSKKRQSLYENQA